MAENNLLPGEWQGAEWTASGNNMGSSPGRVSLTGISEVPALDDDGYLVLQVSAGSAVVVHMGGAQGGGGAVGYLPQFSGTHYDARVALFPDVELTNVSVEAWGAGADGWGQAMVVRLARAEYPTAAAGEVFDETSGLDGTATTRADSGTGRGGRATLSFEATEDGTVTIAPAYYGETAGIPSSLGMYDGDDEDGDEDNGPGPVPDELVQNLAQRVAAYSGKSGSSRLADTAAGQLPIVIEFVRGYTRGHGFNDDGIPAAPLQAVIVAACSRLANNPQQLRQYSVGDYSATPSLMQGFTLVERSTLNRYRRVWA